MLLLMMMMVLCMNPCTKISDYNKTTRTASHFIMGQFLVQLFTRKGHKPLDYAYTLKFPPGEIKYTLSNWSDKNLCVNYILYPSKVNHSVCKSVSYNRCKLWVLVCFEREAKHTGLSGLNMQTCVNHFAFGCSMMLGKPIPCKATTVPAISGRPAP